MDKKMNILIISNKPAFPKLDGGALAMQSLIKVMSSQNYSIDIIAIKKNNQVSRLIKKNNFRKNQKINQIVFEKNMQFHLFHLIKSIWKREAYQASRFYDDEIKIFIQNKINKVHYEIIVFESIFSTIYLKKLNLSKKTKTILRAHNIEHKIWLDLAKNKIFKKIVYFYFAKQIRTMENTMPKYVNYIFTLSISDFDYFIRIFPKKTFNFPVTFDIKNPTYPKIKNSIVHLGSMDWEPNNEGIDWFLNNVNSKLENKNIKVFIAGKNMPERYFNYTKNNTIVEGKIANSNKYIANKEILFVPLLSGSGIRIKILEAMALGIPVVSTSKGAEGIPYTNGLNILIANTGNEFKKNILKLIKNKQLAKTIGRNGQILIKKYFSNKLAIKNWKNIID